MRLLARNIGRAMTSASLLLLASGSLQAAVIETTYSGWDIFGSAKHFEVRNGSPGDWEVGRKDGAAVLETANNNWSNGETKSFTLTHSSVTGDLVLSIDGTSLTWDLPELWGYGQISIMAKGATTGGGSNVYTSTISDLRLDGILLTNNVLSDNNNGKNGLRLTGQYYSDFSLTGDLTMGWIGSNPSSSRIEMFVGVAQAVPLPAGVWLMGSGLFSLLALRRRKP